MDVLYYSEEYELKRWEPFASGYDLHAHLDVPLMELLPGDVHVVPTGIYLGLPRLAPIGVEGLVRPRSGCTKRGLVAQLGTVDASYTGEVGVLLANISRVPMTISRGDRVAQLVFGLVVMPEPDPKSTTSWTSYDVLQFKLQRVDDRTALGETERGSRGFGSSGR